MNTFAVMPINPYAPIFHVKAAKASDAFLAAMAITPVHGIWEVRNRDVN